tara:strand:- start:2140 stop:3090 length:951 start_codon:yes stop_codon:yes gene_type:complete
MNNKLIIFGSNFGSIIHLKAIKKLKNLKKIFICSPNINNKDFKNNRIIKLKNYKKALKYQQEIVGIVTPPTIQKKICEHIIKDKQKIKYILLEKPVASRYKDTKKIINGLVKRNIKFLVNFIFENVSAIKKLVKILRRKKILQVRYNWSFQQMYFQNKIKTWKTNHKLGGGLINFYLIHVFYNLNLFLNELKIIKLESKKTGKLITKLDLLLQDKYKTNIFINININSNKREHMLLFKTIKNNYLIINKSKDWVKNFNLYKDKKKINIKNIALGRENLTAQNYIKLLSSKKIKKNNIDKIISSHKLCDQILNKIYK